MSFVVAIELRYREEGTGGAWKYRRLRPDETTVELPRLQGGKTYRVEARSEASCGSHSPWVSVVHTIDGEPAKPPAPTGLVVTAYAESVALAWTIDQRMPSDIEYEIQSAPDVSGSPPADPETDSPWVFADQTRALSAKLLLEDGVYRWYRVRAVNYLGGASNWAYSAEPAAADGFGDRVLKIVNGSITIDCRYNGFILKLTEDVNDVQFINVPQHTTVILHIEQMAPGSHSLNFGTHVYSLSGFTYVPTTRVGAVDVVGLETVNAGISWQLKADQPIPDNETGYTVSISPDPASATAESDGITPVAPSVQLIASPATNGYPSSAASITWSRADIEGGADFVISGETTLSPTFSLPAGTTAVPAVTQQWRVNVVHTSGAEARDTARVTLSRTQALPTVFLVDRSVADAKIVPLDALAGFRLTNTNKAYKIGGFGGTQEIYDWLTTGNASDYKVQATLVSGDNPSGPMGSFVGLEESREWKLSATNNGGEMRTCVLTLTIQDKATSTTQATCQITLYAETSQ